MLRTLTASIARQSRLSVRCCSMRYSSTNVINPSSSLGSKLAKDATLAFTKDHEWIAIDAASKFAYQGITRYAADSLGDVTFVELPTLDEEISIGDSIGSVESVKSASSVYSPVDGKIVEVNQELEDKPQLVNEDPMGDGWIAKFELSNGSKIDHLLTSQEYESFLQQEEEH